MRPTEKVYTLVALDADGYLNDATGAGPWTYAAGDILAQPSDGCSHPVTINSGAVDLRAITFTLVGTDENDVVITENITGPNATTATSTKYYKTLTSLTASATLGANTIDVGWTALARTRWIVTPRERQSGPTVTVGISGTCTFTAQQTNSNVFDSSVTPVWITLGSASATATTQTVANVGTTAVRCTVASHTSGVLTFAVTSGL